MARSGPAPLGGRVDGRSAASRARRLARLVPHPAPATASAQGALSGELRAADVAGYVVIACFADAAAGCDDARSGVAEIATGGPSAAWVIDGLGAGPFLLLAWRDANGDGEAQEAELVVLLDAAGEPTLVYAPASGLVIASPSAAASPAPSTGPTRSGRGAAGSALAAPAAPAAPVAPVRRQRPPPAPSTPTSWASGR